MINRIVIVKLLICVMSIRTLWSRYNDVMASIWNHLSCLFFFLEKASILVCT